MIAEQAQSHHRKQFRIEHESEHHPSVIEPKTFTRVFFDGSIMTDGVLGVCLPPPRDAWDRQKLVVKYWTIRLEQACEDFEAFRLRLHGLANSLQRNGINGATFDDGDIERLRKLKVQRDRCHRWLMRAQKRLEGLKPQYLVWRDENIQEGRQEAERVRQLLRDNGF
jgi:hypothetical protein